MKSVIFLVINAIRRELQKLGNEKSKHLWRKVITERAQVTKKQTGKNNKRQEEGVT